MQEFHILLRSIKWQSTHKLIDRVRFKAAKDERGTLVGKRSQHDAHQKEKHRGGPAVLWAPVQKALQINVLQKQLHEEHMARMQAQEQVALLKAELAMYRRSSAKEEDATPEAAYETWQQQQEEKHVDETEMVVLERGARGAAAYAAYQAGHAAAEEEEEEDV